MSLALIVAIAANGIIGRDNALPWHIPGDLRWFKRQTLGKAVIMGRRTWESLGRPLPGRTNIVLTRQPDWSAVGALVAASLEAALALAEQAVPGGEAMVIGGAELFAEALPRVERLYLTEIGRAYDGDTLFPPFDRRDWREIAREPQEGDPPFAFLVLERVAPAAPPMVR